MWNSFKLCNREACCLMECGFIKEGVRKYIYGGIFNYTKKQGKKRRAIINNAGKQERSRKLARAAIDAKIFHKAFRRSKI